ncbi:MAG: hypothetical protein N3H31_05945 [Candidatus Nezhaarchaeota archaeon]|nr:hypothetical protein [Candidatus Nezhaarchaeota archaeon]
MLCRPCVHHAFHLGGLHERGRLKDAPSLSTPPMAPRESASFPFIRRRFSKLSPS